MADRQGAVTVRAAGGVVWRMRDGRVEIAVVHRPRYDDWSLPKGKLEHGESELAAAVREVSEELGSRVAVSRRIARIGYPAGDLRKTVTFWLMRHLGGAFEPDHEVDDHAWLPASDARARLSYRVDQRVLDEFVAVPIPESVVVLVRHAKAGKRSEWRGADAKRPLDKSGQAQARRLSEFLAVFGPDRVVSADPLRCVQTVAPLAESLGLDVVVDPVFSDESFEASPAMTETALLALAKPGRVSVVCSQGTAIPGLIDSLVRGVRPSDTRKGAAWALSVVDGTIVSADYYDDASD
ncbi:MAG: NUDIX hydrolase [Jatrophihabitans sp.]